VDWSIAIMVGLALRADHREAGKLYSIGIEKVFVGIGPGRFVTDAQDVLLFRSWPAISFELSGDRTDDLIEEIRKPSSSARERVNNVYSRPNVPNADTLPRSVVSRLPVHRMPCTTTSTRTPQYSRVFQSTHSNTSLEIPHSLAGSNAHSKG